MVLAAGLRLAGTGLASGLIASIAVTRMLESFLYGVTFHDFKTLGSVSTLLLVIAAAACLLLALRASRVDPGVVLRDP